LGTLEQLCALESHLKQGVQLVAVQGAYAGAEIEQEQLGAGSKSQQPVETAHEPNTPLPMVAVVLKVSAIRAMYGSSGNTAEATGVDGQFGRMPCGEN
jgi:hypothetical protein